MQNNIGQVRLVWDWPGSIRRNEIGFGQIKQMVLSSNDTTPCQLNLFLYSFLCPAKNLDLLLTEALTVADAEKFESIQKNLNIIEHFERSGIVKRNQEMVCKKWLEIRKVAARANARDEQRTLATLLFSGPSTTDEVAKDLGISVNLAQRIMRAVQSVLTTAMPEDGRYQLDTDTDSLSATLYLLKCTLGLDPTAVLSPIVGNAETIKLQEVAESAD